MHTPMLAAANRTPAASVLDLLLAPMRISSS
jgi:hypothetical protein